MNLDIQTETLYRCSIIFYAKPVVVSQKHPA